ncbi:MAG: antitoxin Xre/MbcA/ParS toxin-binding domain-containing protein [Bacteroidota bacterium]
MDKSMDVNKDIKAYIIPEMEPVVAMEAEVAYYTPQRSVGLSRSGVTTSFVNDLLVKYHFSKAELARLLDISSKTLDRHLLAQKPFSGLQAERIVLLAELYAKGIRVFGQNEKFIKWLNSTVVAMDHTTPKSWLDTYHGIQLVSDELERIAHGIFA